MIQFSVKSRTGFVIEVMGCPIQWMCKLQTNIATSSKEAEYTALSVALRPAIPLLDVIRICDLFLWSYQSFTPNIQDNCLRGQPRRFQIGKYGTRSNIPSIQILCHQLLLVALLAQAKGNLDPIYCNFVAKSGYCDKVSLN
jgi:hypothetical protein